MDVSSGISSLFVISSTPLEADMAETHIDITVLKRAQQHYYK